MPELPEVESDRRQLEPALVGRRFERVRIDDARLTRPDEPAEVAAELTGDRVDAVERRGKYHRCSLRERIVFSWFTSG